MYKGHYESRGGGTIMTRAELERLPLNKVQQLYHAYNCIIESIEYAVGGPSNVGPNGEYWSAVNRRNMCRQVYNDRVTKGKTYGSGK